MPTLIAGIVTSINSVITGTTPTLATGPRPSAFVTASGMRSWGDRPLADIDREVTVSSGMTIDPLTIGRTTDQLFTGKIEVKIGHSKMTADSTGMYRRDLDIELICRKILDPARYPTDCCLIVKTGESIETLDEFWITTLAFEVTYVGTAIGQ